MSYFTASIFLALCFCMALDRTAAQNFKDRQMKHARVAAAKAEKESLIKSLFASRNIPYPPGAIFIRAFKREQVLELWAARNTAGDFQLLKEYAFCKSSGTLGPKRRQGDGQIPEGFYHVDRFNPVSNFHLSLGVNYPNRADRILGGGGDLGGDIFIHGNCVTVGCVPITDDLIKEVYLIAVEAKSAGQAHIPVHIFPTKMDARGMKRLERKASGDRALLDFWLNLKPGYNFFEQRRRPPTVTIDRRGRYIIKD